MSRRRRDRASPSRATTTRARARRRLMTASRVGLIALAGLVAAALAWTRYHPRSESPTPAILPMPRDSILIAYAVADSASIHEDYATALQLNQRVLAALPHHPLVLRKMALALQNSTNVRPSAEGGPSSHLYRNSLERSATTLRALALLDSAVAYSHSIEDTAKALYWRSLILSREGLHLEQLRVLEQAMAVAPGQPTFEAAIDSARGRLASRIAVDQAPGDEPLGERAR